MRKSGRARPARSINNSIAVSASDSDGTRGQQRQPYRGTEDSDDQIGARVEQVFAVVHVR
jgi:hypothetical protein